MCGGGVRPILRARRLRSQLGALQAFCVATPAFEEGLQVGGEGGFEVHLLPSGGMNETEGAGMQGLPWTDGETAAHKGGVGGRGDTTKNLVATIACIGKEGVAYVGEVGAYLVGAPRFEATLDERDVTEAFKHAPMRDGGFALLAVGREDGHLQAVGGVAPYVAFDAPHVVAQVAPNEGVIEAMGRFMEEL